MLRCRRLQGAKKKPSGAGLFNPFEDELSCAKLFDTSCFTNLCAKVENTGATYTTFSVYFDFVDERRVHWENTLNTNTIRNFTNGKSLIDSSIATLNNIALE